MAGLARRFQESLKSFTGKKYRVFVGKESAESDEPDDDQPSAANPTPPTTAAKPAPAVAAAKPPDTAAAPKLPPPRPELLKAPELWHKTRRDVEASFDQLKAAIRKEYAGQAPALLADIEKSMTKLDGVLVKLDKRLADSLFNAREAKDAATRTAELRNSKKILKEYLKYVVSERLFAKIDANPFGVQTNVKQTLVACLNQMGRAVR